MRFCCSFVVFLSDMSACHLSDNFVLDFYSYVEYVFACNNKILLFSGSAHNLLQRNIPCFNQKITRKNFVSYEMFVHNLRKNTEGIHFN